jgi:hypothetical protein
MATSAKGGKPAVKGGSKRPDPYSYPLPMAAAPIRDETEDHMMGAMGWIFAVILVAFFLPLGAFLYLDILETKNETKKMLEKIERIERRIERKTRDKEPDSINHNPVFDRLRRPISLPMPRPNKLE